MIYKLNGKNIKISDEWLATSMKKLGLTKEEAIEMYLEDEGYFDNEEQAELEKKAKDSKITATIHGAGHAEKKKQTKPKTVKVTDEKQLLFKELKAFLEGFASLNGGKCEVLKENKLITLAFNDEVFKIDLIQQRKPKK